MKKHGIIHKIQILLCLSAMLLLAACSLFNGDQHISLNNVRPCDESGTNREILYGQFSVTECIAAAAYHIQVTSIDDPDFESVIFEKDDNPGSEIVIPDLGLAEGEYLWRVRARGAETWGNWSEAVMVTASSSLDQFNFSQEGTTYDRRPELLWNSVADAEAYAVRIVCNSAGEIYETNSPQFELPANAELSIGDSISYQVRPVFIVSGQQVRGFWSPLRSLSIVRMITMEGSGGSMVNWNDIPGADSYDIRIGDSPSMDNLVMEENGLTDSEVSTETLEDGTYYLQVRALGTGVDPQWSEVVSFDAISGITVVNDHEIVELGIQFNGSTMNSAVFTVENPEQVDSFQWWINSLQLARDAETLPAASLEGDTYTITVIGEKNGIYYSSDYLLERSSPVAITPGSGPFYEQQQVSLSSDSADTIYYALEPLLSDLSNAIEYEGPFTIQETGTVYATAREEGKLCAHESSQGIEILEANLSLYLGNATGRTAEVVATANYPVSHFTWFVDGQEAHTHRYHLVFENLSRDTYSIELTGATLDYSISRNASFTLERANQVVISPDTGIYTESQRVVLSSQGSDTIYYAFEEIADDLSNAMLYEGPFTIQESRTIYATAAASGKLNARQNSQQIVIGDLGVYIAVNEATESSALLTAVSNMPVSEYLWTVNGIDMNNDAAELSLTGLTQDRYPVSVTVSKDTHIDTHTFTLSRVPEVVIEADGDKQSPERTVSLSCGEADEIYYAYAPIAADFSNAVLYDGPFTLDEKQTVYAVGVAEGKLHSHSSSALIQIEYWKELRAAVSELGNNASLSSAAVPYEVTETQNATNVPDEQTYTSDGAPVTFITKECIYEMGGNFDEQILLNPAADIIYPGSVILASSIADGTYREITGGTKNPVRISYDLVSVNGETSGTIVPTLSGFHELHNQVTSQYWGNQSTVMSFEENEIYDETTMEKHLSVGVSAGIGDFGASIERGFDFSDTTINHRYMARFMEKFYTVSVDQSSFNFLYDDIDVNLFEGERPVYVSSITYGRIAYLTLETNLRETSREDFFSAALSLFIDTETECSSTQTEIHSEENLNINVLGVNNIHPTSLDEFEDMIDYDGVNFGNRGVIIAYELRYLDDNSVANVIFNDSYTVLKQIPVEGGGIDVLIRISGMRTTVPDGAGTESELYGTLNCTYNNGSEHTIPLWEHSVEDAFSIAHDGTFYLPDAETLVRRTLHFNNRNETLTISGENFYEKDSGDADSDDLITQSSPSFTFTVGDILDEDAGQGDIPYYRVEEDSHPMYFIEFDIDTSATPIYN